MGEERRHIVSNGRIFGGATLNGRDGTPVLGFPFSHHIKAIVSGWPAPLQL
ncbi:unnamed protein product [Malus baccata var. baccata]